MTNTNNFLKLYEARVILPFQMSHQIPDYVIKDSSQKIVLELHAGRKNTFLRGKLNQSGFICAQEKVSQKRSETEIGKNL